MLEHILQNNDHILDIDLVVTVDIAVSGVLPVAVAGLRLIPALAGGNVELVDLAVVVHVAGCALAHTYRRGRRFDRTQQLYCLSLFVKAGNGHASQSDAVSYVYKNNLMNGVNASRFSPDGTLKRAMMVTMLYRMAGSPAVSGGSAFSDVPSGKWYSDAVQWASANGVVNGVGRDRFAPEAQITREQMASMMMRYAQFNQYNTSKSADLSAFNDAGSISSWALESMKWANAAGLINGRTASTIAPQGTATRAEAATILMRFCEMSK